MKKQMTKQEAIDLEKQCEDLFVDALNKLDWELRNIILDEPELVGANLEVKNDSKFSEDI